jgi:hypothetical protein
MICSSMSIIGANLFYHKKLNCERGGPYGHQRSPHPLEWRFPVAKGYRRKMFVVVLVGVRLSSRRSRGFWRCGRRSALATSTKLT